VRKEATAAFQESPYSLFAGGREDFGFQQWSDEKACLVPEGLNLWSDGRNGTHALCPKQDAQHADDKKPGLLGRLPAFLLVNDREVGFEIYGQRDGFRFALMK
jgi:hypothetical protein